MSTREDRVKQVRAWAEGRVADSFGFAMSHAQFADDPDALLKAAWSWNSRTAGLELARLREIVEEVGKKIDVLTEAVAEYDERFGEA